MTVPAITNLARFQKDLDALVAKGKLLHLAMQYACVPEAFKKQATTEYGAAGAKTLIEGLPNFATDYQGWYSEAKALLTQLLPDRVNDFTRHYEKPKPRKDITFESYRIEDYLQGLSITRWDNAVIVGLDAAIPHFQQQQAILQAAKARFESSLFDIRQLVQADLFDSELDAARELAKGKFRRAAGAMAGVVLERHLRQVCETRGVTLRKKAPGIGDLNNALKDAGAIDVPQWRFVQHLADIRNLCDHHKAVEPTEEQVSDLIAGVAKTIKTLF